MSDDTDLGKLRALLLGEERRTLEQLRTRVEDPALRADDLADVLPDSFARAARSDPGRLKHALQKPIEDCIQDSVRRDKKFFADILFPVIGPAIRKSIAESLREFVASINETVEHTFSPKGIRWRLEALRTGKSFGEVVLKHTLVYRVDQLFLIENRSGLLMQHVSHPEAFSQDSDAVSAMLTAIQDFMQDSFATGEENFLRSVQMGAYDLHLARGPRVTLAGLVRGVAPPELHQRFDAIIDALHDEHAELVEAFAGEREQMDPVRPLLTELLVQAHHQAPARERRRRGLALLRSPLVWLVILALVLLGWWLYRDYQLRQIGARLAAAFGNEPGVVLLAVQRDGGRFRVAGMADPDARDPLDILATVDVGEAPVSLSFAPYASSEPALNLERARRALQVPDSVRASLEDGVLRLEGHAGSAWVARTRNAVLALAGLERIDLSGLQIDPLEIDAANAREAARLREEQRWLAEQRRLEDERRATEQRWLEEEQRLAEQRRAEQERRREAQGLREEQRRQEAERRLKEALEAELAALELNLERAVFTFARGTQMETGARSLDEFSAWIARLMAVCGELQQTCAIEVRGFTDGTGNEQANARLRAARAATLQRSLERAGAAAGWFEIVDPGTAESRAADPSLRKATLAVRREAGAATR